MGIAARVRWYNVALHGSSAGGEEETAVNGERPVRRKGAPAPNGHVAVNRGIAR